MEQTKSFVPALGLDWLTRFYDPLIAATLREAELKRRLIEQAGIAPGMKVLDFGCGTGTLVLMLKRECPGAHVFGLDVDPKVLGIAREKVSRAGLDITLEQGRAAEPPFAPATFDRILTSLVLHHLRTAEKEEALSGLRRLLRPGGELHIADFGPPQNALMWAVSRLVSALDGADRTEANLGGRLPALAAAAGFSDVRGCGEMMTSFGTVAFLRGRA